MTFSSSWRRFVLVLHVATSVGLVGAVAAFLALAIVGATTADLISMQSAYVAMAVLTWSVIVPLAGATLVIGVIQSLGTPWGLFRFYWVVIKLVLTIIACAVLGMQTSTIDALAATARTNGAGAMPGAGVSMILHSAGGLAVLLVATVLSVYKPQGLTSYGARVLEAG